MHSVPPGSPAPGFCHCGSVGCEHSHSDIVVARSQKVWNGSEHKFIGQMMKQDSEMRLVCNFDTLRIISFPQFK